MQYISINKNSMEKQNKGGRPPRYKGEESVRIGFISRPRYKEALKILAKERGCSLSEAAELAFARLAYEYMIDDKPLIDYVRDEAELLKRYCFFCISDDFLHSEVEGEEETLIQFAKKLDLREFIDEKSKIPRSLLGSFEYYEYKVLLELNMQKVNVWKYFDRTQLSLSLKEDWKEGFCPSRSIELILLAIKVAIAFRMYGSENNLENFKYSGGTQIKITKQETEKLKAWLSDNEWNKFSPYFKTLET